MEPSTRLDGLTFDSQVDPGMLEELNAIHKKLFARSVSNKDWTEQTQRSFELVHAILRRNGVALG
jgi:hypothetical protein